MGKDETANNIEKAIEYLQKKANEMLIEAKKTYVKNLYHEGKILIYFMVFDAFYILYFKKIFNNIIYRRK